MIELRETYLRRIVVDLNLPTPGQSPNWAPQLNNEIEKLNANVEEHDSEISKLPTKYTRQRIHIIGINGQSNAGGRGVMQPGRETTPHPRILQWPRTGAGQGTLIPAVDPLRHPDNNPNQGVGFGSTIARMWIEDLPDDDIVVLVPNAFGGTTIMDQGPNGWHPGVSGNLLDRADNAMLAAKTYCEAQYPNAIVSIDAVLFALGETDAAQSVSLSNFRSAVSQMVTQGRSKMGSQLAYVFFDLSPEQRNLKPAARDVGRAFREICRTTPNTGMVTVQRSELGFINSDYLHINTAGFRQVYGPRGYQALRDALAGRDAGVNANEPEPGFPVGLMALSNETFSGADRTITTVDGGYPIRTWRIGGSGTPVVGVVSGAMQFTGGGFGGPGIGYWCLDPISRLVRYRITMNVADNSTSPRLILAGNGSNLNNALVAAPGPPLDGTDRVVWRAVKYDSNGANPTQVWLSDTTISSQVFVWHQTAAGTIRVWVNSVFAFEEPVDSVATIGGGTGMGGSAGTSWDDLRIDTTVDGVYPRSGR